MKQLNFGPGNDPNKTVVHCPTRELAQKVLRIADTEWCSGGKMYLKDEWRVYGIKTCYYLFKGKYGSKDVYTDDFTILPAEEFIRLNTVEQPDAVVGNPFIPFIKDDKVFNYHKGWGTIMDVSEPPKLLCQVDFDSGECRWMDVDELSFTPYTLQGFSQERPKPEIKEGHLIYVRGQENSEWRMRYFKRCSGSKVVCYDNQNQSGSCSTWPEYSLTNPLEEK